MVHNGIKLIISALYNVFSLEYIIKFKRLNIILYNIMLITCYVTLKLLRTHFFLCYIAVLYDNAI